MSFVLDFLLLRRPMLNYISPPICEIFFSSTGVVIGLEPFVSRIVTGLTLGGEGGGHIVWDIFPDDVCYNVYKESAVPGVYDLVLECVPGPDIPPPDPPGCYKVSAITSSGETDLSIPFCISSVPPTVLTLPATDIQNTSAILEGIVNLMGGAASVFFQWGTTAAYGNSTSTSPAGSGSANLPFDNLLGALSSNTTYHYRAAATNRAVLIVGLDQQFTTLGGGGGECVNIFQGLVWGAPVITETGSGGTSVLSVLGENFSAEATAATPSGGQRDMEVTGTFIYTGPAMPCNLHITSAPVIQGNRLLVVSSSVDGLLVLSGFRPGIGSDGGATDNGTFDVPFVIPASAGAVISVLIYVRAIGGASDPGHAKTEGFLTSCP